MKLRNQVLRFGGRIAAGGALALAGIGGAMAQTTSYIPSSASAEYTSMGTDFTTLFGEAFGPLIVIVGSMLVWRYFKKLGSKV